MMLKRLGIMGLTLGVVILAFLVYLGSEGQALALSSDVPQQVTVGEPFEVNLTIRNTTGKPQTITSIGLETALLEQGLEVVDLSPNYRAVHDEGRWQEYSFSIPLRPVLEPDQEFTLKIELVATRAGDYQGEITVWLKNHLQPQILELDIEADKGD